jgi:hypothetical protein
MVDDAAVRRSPDEAFHVGGIAIGAALCDFWAWAGSDLLHNAYRGQLAEYLVARALGCASGARPGWDEFDLSTPDNVRVEVKSSAYIQSWQQARPSTPSFSIRPARRYGEDGREDELRRHSDVYVFALLHHSDRATVDPLDLAQWAFYPLATSVLDRVCPSQKTIALGALVALGAAACSFEGLRSGVNAALACAAEDPRA